MMHECPTKDKDQDPKGKKVLQATVALDDEESENCLSKFCSMAIEEESEDDFERAFEEHYMETIHVAKKNSRSNLRQSPKKMMPLTRSSNVRIWSSNIPRQERKRIWSLNIPRQERKIFNN